MSMLAERVGFVIGVDTHRDTLAAAVLSAPTGGVLAQTQVAADAAGYAALRVWAAGHAPGPRAWAVEGTGSYGAGLAAGLVDAGERVYEIDRVTRGRRGGKSDAVDAVRAAREALGREHLPTPRQHGKREALRMVLTSREGAVRARTAAWNELAALIVTAPEPVRALLRAHRGEQLLDAVARLPHPAGEPLVIEVASTTIRAVATRVGLLSAEVADYDRQLAGLLDGHQLLEEFGVGPVVAAQLLIAWSHPGRVRSEAAFATLAGAAPLPASSGRITRHRLSRKGDRQLNRALHVVALIRLGRHPETQAYATRRRTQGKTNREILRCLKRALARRFHRLLTRLESPQPTALPA